MIIIYNSNTGTTKKYAQELSEKLGCECISVNKANNITDDVIYMGWVMMGDIQGLADARQKFNIKMVVAVGCLSFNEKGINEIISKNSIEEKFFFLPGNFSVKNLSGIYKMMMKMALNMMKGQLKGSENPDDAKALELFEKGVDLYDASKLDELINVLNS